VPAAEGQVEEGQGGDWNETSSLLRRNDHDNVLYDFLHPMYSITEFTVIETCDRDIGVMTSNVATWILQNAE
jgi:hypothetical protein